MRRTAVVGTVGAVDFIGVVGDFGSEAAAFERG